MNTRATEILSKATLTQTQWVVARLTCKSDASAAKKVGVSATAVTQWHNKAELDEAVNLLLLEGAEAALLILKNGAADAAAVVVAALKSKNIDARLRAATIILGKQIPDKLQHSGSIAVITSDEMAKARDEVQEWEKQTFSTSG